jgi:hypothetical protein
MVASMGETRAEDEVLGEIANEMVGLTADRYGKGPVEAKAYSSHGTRCGRPSGTRCRSSA